MRNKRRLTCTLTAILAVVPLLSYAGNDLRLFHEQLERINQAHDLKLVVTSRAYREVKRKGVDYVQRLLVSREVASGWLVLYASGEDPEYIARLYKENLDVWETIFDKSILQEGDKMLRIDLLGVEAAGLNKFMNKTCKTNLVLSKDAGKAPISIIGAENVRKDSLCKDYMLFISASDISIKRALNHVIGVTDN